MSLPKPYYQRGPVTLYHGDCLELLPHLPRVDAVVTDPPYGINTKSDGNGKLSPWADLCNSALWYREWFSLARRLINDCGCMWSFINWRSIATFQKASCDIGWPIESLMVWDKKWIGHGGSRGLRPSYEMVALFCCDGFSIDDRSLADVQAFPWHSMKPNGHPAEKPQSLLEFLVFNSTREDEVVLDLFSGSGTTAVACVATGRNCIGIELDEKWCEIAAKRCDRELDQKRLPFDAPKRTETQRALFVEVTA